MSCQAIKRHEGNFSEDYLVKEASLEKAAFFMIPRNTTKFWKRQHRNGQISSCGRSEEEERVNRWNTEHQNHSIGFCNDGYVMHLSKHIKCTT